MDIGGLIRPEDDDAALPPCPGCGGDGCPAGYRNVGVVRHRDDLRGVVVCAVERAGVVGVLQRAVDGDVVGGDGGDVRELMRSCTMPGGCRVLHLDDEDLVADGKLGLVIHPYDGGAGGERGIDDVGVVVDDHA